MRNPNWPLTFAGMRSLGVHRLAVVCRCGHSSVIDAAPFPDQLPVPAVRARLKCSVCGMRADEAHPAWATHPDLPTHGGPRTATPRRTHPVPAGRLHKVEA